MTTQQAINQLMQAYNKLGYDYIIEIAIKDNVIEITKQGQTFNVKCDEYSWGESYNLDGCVTQLYNTLKKFNNVKVVRNVIKG